MKLPPCPSVTKERYPLHMRTEDDFGQTGDSDDIASLSVGLHKLSEHMLYLHLLVIFRSRDALSLFVASFTFTNATSGECDQALLPEC